MKVRCIYSAGPLTLGEIYTVMAENGKGGYMLAEVAAPSGYSGFWKWRFVPLEEKGDMLIEEFINIREMEENG